MPLLDTVTVRVKIDRHHDEKDPRRMRLHPCGGLSWQPRACCRLPDDDDHRWTTTFVPIFALLKSQAAKSIGRFTQPWLRGEPNERAHGAP